MSDLPFLFFFFFNDTATTEIYTLSLHDALPIYAHVIEGRDVQQASLCSVRLPVHDVTQLVVLLGRDPRPVHAHRSEEHTSELQSRQYLVCRLLLEKKKNTTHRDINISIHHNRRV